MFATSDYIGRLVPAQGEPHAENDEQPADAAVEPDREASVPHQAAAHPRRRPCNEEIPQRAVEVEDRAEKQESHRLAWGGRVDELRQEGEKDEGHLRISTLVRNP